MIRDESLGFVRRRNVFPMVTPVRTSETGGTDQEHRHVTERIVSSDHQHVRRQLIDQKLNRLKGLLRRERRGEESRDEPDENLVGRVVDQCAEEMVGFQ